MLAGMHAREGARQSLKAASRCDGANAKIAQCYSALSVRPLRSGRDASCGVPLWSIVCAYWPCDSDANSSVAHGWVHAIRII